MSVINAVSLPGTEIGRDMKQPGSVLSETSGKSLVVWRRRWSLRNFFSNEKGYVMV